MGEVELSGYYTMVDIANEYQDKQLVFIANSLARLNEIMQDAPMTEANEIFSHKGAQDASLPSPGFRRFNEGVAPTTAKSRPIIEGLAICEDYSLVDYELYRIQPKKEVWRQGKDRKHIEGMSQKMANEVFNGNLATDPAGIKGLVKRFDSLTTYPNGDSTWEYNVQDNGGSTNRTSIWVIEWDPEECCFVYPRGSKGGIEFEDLGKKTEVDSTGKRFESLTSHFLWKMGIFISDERRVQRIANISSTGTSDIFNEDKLIDAILRTPSRGANRAAIKIYCNARMLSQMWKRLKDKNNVHFTSGEGLSGRRPLDFDGYPFRICDAISNAESAAA